MTTRYKVESRASRTSMGVSFTRYAVVDSWLGDTVFEGIIKSVAEHVAKGLNSR